MVCCSPVGYGVCISCADMGVTETRNKYVQMKVKGSVRVPRMQSGTDRTAKVILELPSRGSASDWPVKERFIAL